jgi:sigma-B regulation protein RsbU (phosphoserine phosphatase)
MSSDRPRPGSTRPRLSLRARLLLASVLLVAAALGVAAIGFERAARRVVVEDVQSHLATRSVEVQNAVLRFQRERALTVRNWSEIEAMKLTLDSGDPKFAEDYLRRSIQDQGGAFAAAALLDADGRVVVAVRAAPEGARGLALEAQRGRRLESPLLSAALGGRTGAGMGRLSDVDADADGASVVMVAPVKDFAGDLQGVVIAALAPASFTALLAGISSPTDPVIPVVLDASRQVALSPATGWPVPLAELVDPRGAPGALERIPSPVGTLLVVRTEQAPQPPGWTAAMIVPERLALAPLRQLRALLAALYGLVLVAAVTASVWALRHAVRPLTSLSHSMSRVAGGDLSIRLAQEYGGELGAVVRSFNTMVSEVGRSRSELQRTEALRRDLEIAHRIQTAILPAHPEAEGFEIAARMKPAADVGGDLYDVLTFEDTFWLLVGDVSGHGINSGLVMMMAQSAASAAISEAPHRSPCEVIRAVNRVVYENVRRRMGRDDYLTLIAARHVGGGRFVAAGAHQPVFLARAGGAVEVVDFAGPWCGVERDPGERTVEYGFEMGPGDLICLITDGVIESKSAASELYGEDRLRALLACTAPCSAANALERVFSDVEAFAPEQADDMTAVVVRRIP